MWEGELRKVIKGSRLGNKFKLSVFVVLILTYTTQAGSPYVLFDGTSLSGWQFIGDAQWFVDNMSIVGTGGDGYLATETVYDSYRLKLEFRVDSKTNSGVFVQCQDRNDISPLTCFEINIWDEHPRQEYRTGAIVTLKSPEEIIDTLGRWNYYDILVTPQTLSVTLNGVMVSKLELPDKPSGFIALQRKMRGYARFRNLTLQPIVQ